MQQLKKVWRFVKRYITKYYIAFFCGGVVWMLLDVYAVKGIDASFVSAVADTLLVVFAFIALIEARRVWIKRAKEDGYKIALELLNYKFINTVMAPGLSDWIQFTESLSHWHKRLKIQKKKNPERIVKNDTVLFIKRLKPCFDTLDESYRNRVFPLSQEIQFDIFRMRNAGVDFSTDETGEFLKKHFMDFLLLSQKCSALSMLLNAYIATHTESEFLDEILDLEDELDDKYSSLDKIFEIFNDVKCISLRLLCNLNDATATNKNDIHSYFDFN